MKVAEFRDILLDLKRVYAAAGAKVPAKDMGSLADAMKGANNQEFDDFLKTLDRPPIDSANLHIAALVSAELDIKKFEAALGKLEKDKSIKAADLEKIGVAYTKSPKFGKLYKTRKAKLTRLRQAFRDKKEFESRGKVIDGLLPWQ